MRVAARCSVAAAVLLVALGAFGTPRVASADVYFTALARADGMRVVASDPHYLPLDATGEVGFPTAQSQLSANGSSTGFASYPYPGAVVLGVPGLIASQVPGAPDEPYPAYVESSYPRVPRASLAVGPFALSAGSTADSSESRASSSFGQTNASAGLVTASTETSRQPDGGLDVRSSSRVESLDIGGALRLGRVTSQLRITRAPSGEVRRTSTFEVEGASVAGQAVSLTSGGLTVGPAHTPLQETPLDDVLAEHGVTVNVLAPRNVGNGSVGAGLEITVTQSTNGVAGAPSLTYTLGRGFVLLTTTLDGPAASGSVRPPPPVVPGHSPAPVPGRVSSGSPAASGPAVAEGGPGPAVAMTSVQRPDAAGAAALFRQLGSAAYYWYLALVVAAATCFSAGQLLRVLGVRQPRGASR